MPLSKTSIENRSGPVIAQITARTSSRDMPARSLSLLSKASGRKPSWVRGSSWCW
jgi:hypothetical protein